MIKLYCILQYPIFIKYILPLTLIGEIKQCKENTQHILIIYFKYQKNIFEQNSLNSQKNFPKRKVQQSLIQIAIFAFVFFFMKQSKKWKINICSKMELKGLKKLDTSRRYKLPVLGQTKPHLLSKATNSIQLSSSTERLKDLKKLYFQYRSNANILTNSPYFTNRQQQKQLIAYINTNKYQLQSKIITEINQQFPQENSQNNDNQPSAVLKSVKIKLLINGHLFECQKQAKNIGELVRLLKIQYALNQYKLTGTYKKALTIIGFQTVNDDPSLDYLLSLKNNQIYSNKMYLKPIFLLSIKGRARLQHFKMVRCLGSGGFSLVYLVRDCWKGQYYALKLIDKNFILDSQRETIVQNQRFVLGEIHSPFVTELKFCFQTKNHFAFMIQYCPGGELFYQLKKVKKMTQQQAKFYFLQILLGLDYLHQKNIVYRDLKPQNLLIGADGHLRIADFGLAKPLLNSPRKIAYSFCGSPQYMAPQMLLKSGHSFTLDYYCLGALLYELVLGIPPYYSLNHEQIYQGILHEQLFFPSHTPLTQEIKSLLRGLLQKNPNKRLGSLYGIKEILIHPWVGKVSRKTIEQKKLTPPFIPDLSQFNFDESELQQKADQTDKKIKQDLQTPRFESYFNSQFYFQQKSLVFREKEKQLSRPKRQLKKDPLNKENRLLTRSLEHKPKVLQRVLSQKLKIHF